MKTLLIVPVTAWLLASSASLQADEAPRPNIIFILADDLGWGDVGCYGQRKIRTPNLDRLAVEGMRFTDCYAGSPVCGPSRSVLMTGQHTGHTRVRGNSCVNAGKRAYQKPSGACSHRQPKGWLMN